MPVADGPTATDPLVRAASAVVGGPAGRRSAGGLGRRDPSAWAAPLLVLGGTALLALAALSRSACRAADFSSPAQFTHACYSDVASRIASGTVADQPRGAGLLTQLLDAATGSLRGAFDASVLLAVAALAAAVLALVLRGREVRRPWDAAALALSPVLLTAGLVSLELVAVAGTALALLARARGRHAVTGALLAASGTVDPLALVVLAALWAASAAARRGAEVLPGVVGAVVALGGTTLLWRATGLADASLANPEAATGGALAALAAVWVPGWGPQPGYGSLWLLPSLVPGAESVVPGWLVVAGAAVGTAATGVLVVVLARRWARADRDAADGAEVAGRDHGAVLALVAVVGVLVVAPTVPVQSSLLLLPLVAAVGLRWHQHLPWAGVDALFAVTTWLYIYGQQVASRGAEPWVYGVLLALRLAGLVWLAVAAARGRDGDGEPVVDPVAAPPAGVPVDDGRAPALPPVGSPVAQETTPVAGA